MSKYSVQLTGPAAEDLDSLPSTTRRQVIEGIFALATEPPARRKLKGFRFPLIRCRVRNHRILYRIDAGVVTVMRDLIRELKAMGCVLSRHLVTSVVGCGCTQLVQELANVARDHCAEPARLVKIGAKLPIFDRSPVRVPEEVAKAAETVQDCVTLC